LYPASSYRPSASGSTSASWRRRRSWTIVEVRSARLRSMRARATSVVRRRPAVIPSG